MDAGLFVHGMASMGRPGAFELRKSLAVVAHSATIAAMSSAFGDLLQLPVIDFYETAFRKATGIPLKVVAPGEPRQRICLGAGENAFCSIMGDTPVGCAACLDLQVRSQRIVSRNRTAQQISCYAGLTEVAVPVMVGGEHIATLMSGRIFRREPTDRDFNLVAAYAREKVDPAWEKRAREAYFATPVITSDRLQAVISLLDVFAKFLADYASHHALDGAESDPPAVAGAKAYVQSHFEELITLDKVVAHVGVSRFYFCKLFKKATGMTLTEYVARVRVEKAKRLLEDPALRISEVVFAAGFGSIPHFNTVFKRYAGLSPTEYRESLHDDSPPVVPLPDVTAIFRKKTPTAQ